MSVSLFIYLPGGDSVGLLVAPSCRMTAVRRRKVNRIFDIDQTVASYLFVGFYR